MSRYNTQVLSNIRMLCRMQNIDEKVLYERAKLILSIYREVCWSTIDRANDVCDTLICTYGDSLDGALIYLENFAPDEARERFEERIRSLFETKWIIELVDMAMLKIREYPDKGALYCEIISKAYGYKVSPKNKHQMIVDPETAPIVRRIFTDVIAGKSTSQVARELNAEGILTPQQYKGVARRKGSPSKALWTHNRILDMLKNVKYTGCMVNHTRESMVIRAKSQRRVPKKDWIYHENAHEAIVTTEEFEAAQAALRKVRPHTKKNKENSFPFYCAHCGRKLQRTFGTDVHFYCVTPYWDTDEEPCKSVRWDRTDIEEVVLAALKAQIAVMTVETVGKIQNTTSEGTLLRQRLKVLASELESGDTQKVQSYLDYREGRITKEEFIALRSEREKRMEELKNLIAETEAAYEDFLEKENQAKQEQAIVERTSSMNDEALKELMYDAVERINVTDNQNIEIIWKFDDLFATA